MHVRDGGTEPACHICTGGGDSVPSSGLWQILAEKLTGSRRRSQQKEADNGVNVEVLCFLLIMPRPLQTRRWPASS